MDLMKKSLEMHKEFKGKMEIVSKVPLKDSYDLSLAYSPGVAAPCQEIEKSPMRVYDYTMKGNLVAVVSDGTAVLGLGDIGPEAALPVMEGKALLLKRFANVDAVPITLNTKDVDEIVRTVKAISPTFGAINLEDIAAPRCFEIEERLKAECNIPIFHDDQHGTAIVVAAGLENALKLVGKRKEEVKIVINGAGAAGIATLKLLASIGYKNIVVCDSKGILYEGRSGMNAVKEEIAKITNPEKLTGTLDDAMVGTDIFIGVSIANILTKEHIDSMNQDPIVFALANPNPEITNVLAFPGIFRGALDVFATEINEEMKIAAVNAIASLVDENELREDYVIPKPLDERVVPAVAKAVANAAIETGVSRLYSNQQAKVI